MHNPEGPFGLTCAVFVFFWGGGDTITRSQTREAALASGAPRPPLTSSANKSTFERETLKYWIEPEHVTALKLAILKELPVYVRGGVGFRAPADVSRMIEFSPEILVCPQERTSREDRMHL